MLAVEEEIMAIATNYLAVPEALSGSIMNAARDKFTSDREVVVKDAAFDCTKMG